MKIGVKDIVGNNQNVLRFHRKMTFLVKDRIFFKIARLTLNLSDSRFSYGRYSKEVPSSTSASDGNSVVCHCKMQISRRITMWLKVQFAKGARCI